MAKIHNLGFPRIGDKRQLKFALEAYWHGNTDPQSLQGIASELRQKHWQQQTHLDYVPVGDFSFYDQVLDMSFTLGNIPNRATKTSSNELDTYFKVARGRANNNATCDCTHAGEMTKWFDTNYHYIVPEFDKDTHFSLNATRLTDQIKEAKNLGLNAKPVIIGPLTYLWLGKEKGIANKLDLLPQLLPVYNELLNTLSSQGIDWVQIDEPILVTELDTQWQQAFIQVYDYFKDEKINILLATYFGDLKQNLALLSYLPVAGLHIDAVNAQHEVNVLIASLQPSQVLSLGVINGRNIWKSDLNQILSWLSPIAKQLQERLWIAPSCSLLHVPVNLNNEENLDAEIKSWLAFALDKLDELSILAHAINQGAEHVKKELEDNRIALQNRKNSTRVHNPNVKNAVNAITQADGERNSPFEQRIEQQSKRFSLPIFPTTTIGSFPQTADIRKTRQAYKKQTMSFEDYQSIMQTEIKNAIQKQEELGLDVLVHGEAERNDMVEYFGEQLEGYVFSQFGWVQSYGSRCVKPPILFGDISRPKPMTVEWTQYAQKQTTKPLKGMLTGPVTILNWSFVRDDQPREQTCYQLALAIRAEVQDLEQAGVSIIQIDEAALREGLPLRKQAWQHYLDWAVESFRISANGVKDTTQIHTHMCYSEFNDIIEAIAKMDADVITIETSRSDMELLNAFDEFNYPNDIGPGVYDIHSPNTPSTESIVKLMSKAAEKIPHTRLWINPDCGLKTRQWPEVIPALTNMISAAKILRKNAILQE